MGSTVKTFGAVAASAIGVAVGVSPAAAAPPSHPPSTAAVSVYVEQIPSSTGNVAASGAVTQRGKVAPSIAKKVRAEGGTDATELGNLAASGPQTPTRAQTSRAGATPPTRANSTSKPTSKGASPRRAARATSAPVAPRGATAQAAQATRTSSGGSSHVTLFLLLLAVGSAVMVVGAFAVRGRDDEPRDPTAGHGGAGAR